MLDIKFKKFGRNQERRQSRKDFILEMHDLAKSSGHVAFEKNTARTLLGEAGHRLDTLPMLTADERNTHSWILELGIRHGWDTTLYRADFMRPRPDIRYYLIDPVDEFEACCAVFSNDVRGHLEIFEDGHRLWPSGPNTGYHYTSAW